MNISRKRSEYYKRANKDLYKSGLCGITALFSVCIIAFVSTILRIKTKSTLFLIGLIRKIGEKTMKNTEIKSIFMPAANRSAAWSDKAAALIFFTIPQS